GLYSVGYGLMVTYAGMIFKAMDADFFPRLSSINHDTQRLNHAINQQIDVCVSLMAPFLIIFILFMPWVVSLLYSGQFLPVVPMAVCAVFYMFFKAVTTPMAYTALAKGDSFTFLLVETIYNVVFVWLMMLGYSRMGLTGTGLALSASALFDLLLIGISYGIRYRVRLRLRTLTLIFPQAVLLTVSVLACLFGTPLLRYVVCLSCLLLSIWFSWKRITPELPVLEKLRHKIGGKKGANDLSEDYDKSER
ncbi:MAG: oligosaccharide flippase family protein, partial [Bacteroidaceae bacterium]|nr:oligosaccharide flippase family protein [Bacteroidaceae bacterium]